MRLSWDCGGEGYMAVGKEGLSYPARGSWVSCPQAPSPRTWERHQPLTPTLGWPLVRGHPGQGSVFPNSGGPDGGGLLLVILILEARRPESVVSWVLGSVPAKPDVVAWSMGFRLRKC